MKHAAILPLEKTLCNLDSKTSFCGWGFTETDMKINKGQQYNLFRNSVDCPECLEIAKNMLNNICDCCGKEL